MIINALETVTCGRCSGTGSYSWCSAHGSTCFKCHGKKVVLTKRGSIANQFIKWIRATDTIATELKVGDWVRMQGESKFWKIVSIAEYKAESRYKDFPASAIAGHDVWVDHVSSGFKIGFEKVVYHVGADSMIARHNNLDDLATWKTGMEFQTTLSKTGKATKKTSAQGLAFFEAIAKK